VSRDILQGLRLALGVAWIVLVPAEYLGVTSGLGYAINDARDTLSYDRLGALVLLIGIIGFFLDSIIALAIKRTQWTPTA
jgi:NitT/TauT family transport system permease protein